jgi:hypothetical protein
VDELTGKNDNRNAVIAAAVIMIFFGGGFYVMPTIMRAVGAESPAAAGVIAVAFVASFFVIFWVRSKISGKDDG